ncbi:MAG: hypothetical protein ACM31C_00965 [Acidobacteriota bacterium]
MNTIENFGEEQGSIGERVREYGERIDERVEDLNKREGTLTSRIERVTAALPSTTWLMLAGGAMIGSLVLRLVDREKTANFVGEWVPTFLLLGIYNKLVKLHGSDRESM